MSDGTTYADALALLAVVSMPFWILAGIALVEWARRSGGRR